MVRSVRLPPFLTALGLALPLLAAAQTPALTDAERARRDAEKVLSFIKFQTVKTKLATEPGERPHKPVAPGPQRATGAVRQADFARAAEPAPSLNAARTPPDTAPAVPLPGQEPAAVQATFDTPAPPSAAFATTAGTDGDTDTDEQHEVALQLQRFVAPVLMPSVQATLVGGSRKVTVRFTVETDGTVSKAEAAADAPRRLARPATDAVLQWQFAPLAHARTADVELAFRRE